MSGITNNEEQISKLSQLDRIEFRQRFDFILKIYSFDLPLYITLLFTGVYAFLVKLLTHFNIGNPIYGKYFFYYFLFLFFILLFKTIYSIILRRKHIKELANEYFKINPKKNKK